MNEIKLKKYARFKDLKQIVDKYEDVTNENFLIDLSELQFLDSNGANMLLLLPYFLKENKNNIRVKFDLKSDISHWLKHIGIVDRFKESFEIEFDPKDIPIFKSKREEIIYKYRNRTADLFQYNPFVRTFFAKNKYDVQVLNEIIRFSESIGHPGLYKSKRITTCLVELINNIFEHSEENFGAISIHYLKQYGHDAQLNISVTDFGIGIKNSLKKSSKYTEYSSKNDVYFIQQAVYKNVSSTDEANRGFGLHLVSRCADRVHITSGEGKVSIVNNEIKKTKKDETDKFRGTNISCVIFPNRDMNR